jgi:hypothetical protein
VVDARPKAAPRVNENRDATGTSGIRTIQTQDRYTEAALRRKIEIETSDEAHVCKECEPKLCNQMWKLWKRQNEAKNTDFSLSP